tara:strand:+ start:346 stop:951 length:606 start_codon:yes stop_codon:yes gene_type:complete
MSLYPTTCTRGVCTKQKNHWTGSNKFTTDKFRQLDKQASIVPADKRKTHDAAHILDLEIVALAASNICKDSCDWTELQMLANAVNSQSNYLVKTSTQNRGTLSREIAGLMTENEKMQALGGGCGAFTTKGTPMLYHASSDRCQQEKILLKYRGHGHRVSSSKKSVETLKSRISEIDVALKRLRSEFPCLRVYFDEVSKIVH